LIIERKYLIRFPLLNVNTIYQRTSRHCHCLFLKINELKQSFYKKNGIVATAGTAITFCQACGYFPSFAASPTHRRWLVPIYMACWTEACV